MWMRKPKCTSNQCLQDTRLSLSMSLALAFLLIYRNKRGNTVIFVGKMVTSRGSLCRLQASVQENTEPSEQLHLCWMGHVYVY